MYINKHMSFYKYVLCLYIYVYIHIHIITGYKMLRLSSGSCWAGGILVLSWFSCDLPRGLSRLQAPPWRPKLQIFRGQNGGILGVFKIIEMGDHGDILQMGIMEIMELWGYPIMPICCLGGFVHWDEATSQTNPVISDLEVASVNDWRLIHGDPLGCNLH